MRRRSILVVVAALTSSCGFMDDDPAVDGPAGSVTTSSTAPSTTTTTTTVATTTTAAAALPPTGSFACPAAPPRPAPAPDRPRYVVRLTVDLAANAVAGDVDVRFTPDLPTDRLVFRLWPNAPRIAAAGGKLEAGPVSVAGHQSSSSMPDATTLVVAAGRTIRAGESVDVSMPWRLTLPRPVKDRVSRTGDAVRLGSFLPLLAWEPGVGWATEPPASGFAEATTSPVADFSMSITAPDGLQVMASGVPDGSGRWTATAARDVAVSVGRFRTATGTAHAPGPVSVAVGVHDGLGDDPQRYVTRIVASLEDFARRYGPYPWPTYTLSITPDLTGGIEYPMHVLQGPGSGGRTTPHEVAHMWFYGLVGNNQGRDPWLDEGLATFAEARFENTLGSMRSRSIPADARGRAGEPMSYWEQRPDSYYRGVYVQGAQALAALGPADAVDCALRHHVAVHANRVATNRSFVDAIRPVFPDAAAVLARYGIKA